VARRGFRIFEGRAEESNYCVYTASCEGESWVGCVQIMDQPHDVGLAPGTSRDLLLGLGSAVEDIFGIFMERGETKSMPKFGHGHQ